MPKRNIFVVLNVSNDSNFDSDSGYIFQKILWQKLTKINNDIHVFFLGHQSTKESWSDKITIIPFFQRFDKYSTRFHFDWHGLRDLIRELPPVDLVINNQPEHTLALKMLFSSENKQQIKIISYYHYLPFYYNDSSIVFDESQNLHGFAATYILGRNLEAMEVSDLNLIGSKFGIDICKKAYKDYYKRELKKPFERLVPPIEDALFQIKEASKDGSVQVLYNQRLYKHYGIKQILDLLEELSKEVKFKLIVTNPTGKRSKERDRLDPNVNGVKLRLENLPFVEFIECLTRQSYHELLSKIDFAIGPIKPSALWSMAVTDVLASGKPVLCPNTGAFPEIVNFTPNLLFDNSQEFKTKFKAMLNKKSGYNISSSELRLNIKDYSEVKTAEKMLHYINSL